MYSEQGRVEVTMLSSHMGLEGLWVLRGSSQEAGEKIVLVLRREVGNRGGFSGNTEWGQWCVPVLVL